MASVEERLLAKVLLEGDCWIWTGAMASGRVPVAWLDNVNQPVRRWVMGPVPYDHDVIAACGDGRCIAPAHMEVVTRQERDRRGGVEGRRGTANVLKTRCVNGHDFTPENTYVGATGYRACRACQRSRPRDPEKRRATARRYYWKHREAILEKRAIQRAERRLDSRP